jgi:hypothetical protein
MAVLSLLAVLLLLASASCSFKGWVDPATPEEFRRIKSYHHNHITYELIMSDEFETPGRNMKDGTDPTWTAIAAEAPAR